MEALILEIAQVYGLPIGLASAVAYYMVKRGPPKQQADGMEDVRLQIQRVQEQADENRKLIQEVRDMVLVIKDRGIR